MIDKPVGRDNEMGLPVVWGEEIGSTPDDLRTSLPYETDEDRLGVLAIFESETVALSTLIGKELLISDYIARPCQILKQDTGELVPAVRLVLLGPGQQPVSTTSIGIFRSLSAIAKAMQGAPPWDPPVKVAMVQVACRGGRTFKLIPTDGRKKW